MHWQRGWGWGSDCIHLRQYCVTYLLWGCTYLQLIEANRITCIIWNHAKPMAVKMSVVNIVGSLFTVCSVVNSLCLLLQVIFVGYFGGKSHQPRIIGSSALAMGLGCLIMSLAYFTSPTYTPQTGEFSLICHPGGSESKIIHLVCTEAIFYY